MHERFNVYGEDNSDIALIKLVKPMTMSNRVSGICLQNKLYEEPPAKKLRVVGWGRTNHKREIYPDIMQQVTLDKLGPVRCMRKWKTEAVIYHSQMCLHDKGKSGKDACNVTLFIV